MHIPANTALLQALAARLLQDETRALWREVFEQGGARQRTFFEQQPLTLVHVELEMPDALPWRAEAEHEVGWVAACHDGVVESRGPTGWLMRFASPRSALRAALVLQRVAPSDSLRVGISGGLCTVATVYAQQRRWSFVLGVQVDRARDVAMGAVPGTINLAAESCEEMGDILEEEVGSGLISIEFDGAVMAQATVTLPPRPNAAQSSFAGLGLL
jgi:hypothetical protein